MDTKITIEDFVCTTKELISEDGYGTYGQPNNRVRWGMADYPEVSKNHPYASISAALNEVCTVLSFDFEKKDWHYEEIDSTFTASFYVDESNTQITEEEYKFWKCGEKRIWVCTVVVKIMVTEKRMVRPRELRRLGFI